MDDSLWPWLAVAGAGALHGLNPATGWLWSAAWRLRSRDRAAAWRALLPIAVGHVASVALAAAAVAQRWTPDRTLLQLAAGGVLAAGAAMHLHGGIARRARAPARHAGLALWSFMMSTAHGAGMMLVPALAPLCAGAAVSGPLALALAAVAVHLAAMLAVTGGVGALVARGIAGMRRGKAADPPATTERGA